MNKETDFNRWTVTNLISSFAIPRSVLHECDDGAAVLHRPGRAVLHDRTDYSVLCVLRQHQKRRVEHGKAEKEFAYPGRKNFKQYLTHGENSTIIRVAVSRLQHFFAPLLAMPNRCAQGRFPGLAGINPGLSRD